MVSPCFIHYANPPQLFAYLIEEDRDHNVLVRLPVLELQLGLVHVQRPTVVVGEQLPRLVVEIPVQRTPRSL